MMSLSRRPSSANRRSVSIAGKRHKYHNSPLISKNMPTVTCLTRSEVVQCPLCCHEAIADTQTHSSLKHLDQLIFFGLQCDLFFPLRLLGITLWIKVVTWIPYMIQEHLSKLWKDLKSRGESGWRGETVEGWDGILISFVHSFQLLGADAGFLAHMQQQLVFGHLHPSWQCGCSILVTD